MFEHPDAHQKPPVAVKAFYKSLQRLDTDALLGDARIIDLANGSIATSSKVRRVDPDKVPLGVEPLPAQNVPRPSVSNAENLQRAAIFEAPSIPGLFVYPSLLSQEVQLDLLDKLLHRDLCNPQHQTNLHLHNDIPYPTTKGGPDNLSFFDSTSQEFILIPKDPSLHRPLPMRQALDKKLRWMTLGGQYDWTNKVYPSSAPPPFPSDIKNLIESLFPMKAEAAIVNLYSPGDTLSVHRDVSEECDRPLVSISLGCEGIFVIALDEVDEHGFEKMEAIRLRSGDAVLMSGKSRYAWHGVPKVLEGTCPFELESWPCIGPHSQPRASDERFEAWRYWLKGKRINLNIRQMFA